MEEDETPECGFVHWCYANPLPICLRVDAEWDSNRVRQ